MIARTYRSSLTPHGRVTPRKVLSAVLPGAALGGATLGTATTLERVVHHSSIYRSPADVGMHVAWAWLAGIPAAVFVCTLATLTLGVSTRWLAKPSTFSLARVGLVTGGIAGAIGYDAIIMPSKLGNIVSPWVGRALSFGAVAGFGALAAPVLWRFGAQAPRALGAVVAAATTLIAHVDLHRYMRSYGAAHFALEIALLLATGLLGSAWLWHKPTTLRRRVALVAAGMWSMAICLVALATPTPQARTAVLVYGTIERTLTRHVLWPAADSDDDGFASWGWGSDCDDDNANSHPLSLPLRSRHFGCEAIEPEVNPAGVSESLVATDAVAGQQSVVWIVVDTLRPEALDSVVDRFVGFERLPAYRSCGSDTKTALTQLFGRAGCRPKGRGKSLVADLGMAGFETACFLQYVHTTLRMSDQQITDVFGAFDIREESLDERVVVEKAAAWVANATARGKPFFVFVHLNGGHAPYTGLGDSAKARHLAAAEGALRSAADLVDGISPEHMVVVMGDHGEEFGEHDGTAHAHTLYEEVLETPLLIRGLALSDDARSCLLGCPELVALTFYGATGAHEPPTCGSSARGRLAFVDFPSLESRGPRATHLRSLHLPDGLKVIWDSGRDIWELYDLAADPGESLNLAVERPEALRRAAKRLAWAMGNCSATQDP